MRDAERNAYMRALGLAVVRIPASNVMRDADAVAEELITMCAGMMGPSTTQLC